MTDTTHPSDAVHRAHSGDAPHGETHAEGAHADAGHGGHDHAEPLGPIDWGAWGGGILGVLAGLVVAACLWFSTAGL